MVLKLSTWPGMEPACVFFFQRYAPKLHVPVVKVVFYVKYVPTFTSLRLRARDSFFVFLLSFVWHSGMRPVPVVEVRFYGAETFAP